ncbi:hypothetical protein QYE76_059983 [Lolium multiflorum]|uniref:Uncharacterized protein n=1 Tax=Lolium multiflorum TaxID=4521 RepID=A0AAD8RZL6_LOLMU|nr:hypothetical protein QYE76_059983 [Lolium multiflorum]
MGDTGGRYDGYTLKSRQLSIATTCFFQFVTGAPRLPLGGLSALNPKLIIIRKSREDIECRMFGFFDSVHKFDHKSLRHKKISNGECVVSLIPYMSFPNPRVLLFAEKGETL